MGYPHPDHLLRELTSCQITEWLAYYQMEPFGDERADLRAGIVASTIANVNRGENTEAMSPEQFMPKFDTTADDRRQTTEEQLAIIEAMAAVYGGEITRG